MKNSNQGVAQGACFCVTGRPFSCASTASRASILGGLCWPPPACHCTGHPLPFCLIPLCSRVSFAHIDVVSSLPSKSFELFLEFVSLFYIISVSNRDHEARRILTYTFSLGPAIRILMASPDLTFWNASSACLKLTVPVISFLTSTRPVRTSSTASS